MYGRPVTVIDAHHHLWDLSVRPQRWLEPPELAPIRRSYGLDDLLPRAARCAVTGTVLVQTQPSPEETAEFLRLAAPPDALVRGVVGWADLTAPDVADRLAALRELPGGERLVGIRHDVQNEPDQEWLLRPDVQRGLRAVAAAGLAYDLVVREPQWPAVRTAVRALPEVAFVLDHLGKPPVAAGRLEPWSGWLGELAAEPNVAAKVSGLVTEADWERWTAAGLRPYVERALGTFGPGRLMFGSDWPVCLLAAPYEEVARTAQELASGLSADERAALFAGTAVRVYGLG